MAENQNNAQQPDPRWPGRTAEEAAVLESIARSAGRKWAEANVDLILAQAQAAADAAWPPGLKKAVRRTLVALAVVIVAAVIVLRYVTDDPSAEVFAKYVRIVPGTTLEEMTELLGPPGDYRTVPNTENDSDRRATGWSWAHYSRIHIWDYRTHFKGHSDNPTRLDWRTDTADIAVWVNDSGQALDGAYTPMRIVDDSTWGKLVRSAKRLWRGWFS